MKQVILGILFLSLACDNGKREKFKSVENNIFGLLGKIERLDTLYVNFELTGCEEYFLQNLLFYYEDTLLVSELQTIIPNSNIEIPTFITQTPDSAIQTFFEFEKMGRKLKPDNMCTTNEKYLIALKADTIRFEAPGCGYEKYEELKRKIFGDKRIEELTKKIYR